MSCGNCLNTRLGFVWEHYDNKAIMREAANRESELL